MAVGCRSTSDSGRESPRQLLSTLRQLGWPVPFGERTETLRPSLTGVVRSVQGLAPAVGECSWSGAIAGTDRSGCLLRVPTG